MGSFDFLDQCKKLGHITIELKVLPNHYSSLEYRGKYLVKNYDVEPLYSMKNLKSLSVIDGEEPYVVSKIQIDLSRFSGLEEFLGDSKHVKNISEARGLKTLWLNGYEKDSLLELSELSKLDTLELDMPKITSLDGCEKMYQLQCLYLRYGRRLSDISALEKVKHSLKALRIENCARIEDFSVLEKLEALELLELSGSNEIPDISFIKKMKNLKTFVFTVNILDGDLSPCLGLQYVACARGRKHYNLKDGKLPKGEYVRGNEDIDMWRRFE